MAMQLLSFTNALQVNRLRSLALTFLLSFSPLLVSWLVPMLKDAKTVVPSFFLLLLIACIVALAMFATMIGVLIASLMTLQQGAVVGGFFMLAATLPYFLRFYVSVHDETLPIMLWAAIMVAVISNVLTWIFAVMLKQRVSWSKLIQLAALLGVLTVSVLHLVYPNIIDWWGQQLQTYYHQVATVAAPLGQNVQSETKNLPTEQIQAIQITKNYVTGFIIAAILANAFFQLALARWWQTFLYKQGLLRKELRGLRLSHLAGFLFLLALFLNYLGNSVISDIMPIVYLLFIAAGLSLIHYFLGLMTNRANAWVLLIFIYILFIYLFPESAILVSFLALIDCWMDNRKRAQH